MLPSRATMGPTALAALAGLATMFAGAQSADAEPYAVVVRQLEGSGSVPAHMTCSSGKLCRGAMSVSTGRGQLRVLITGMIDPPYAYFRFSADGRALGCGGPQHFVTVKLRETPGAAHGDASLCDAARGSDTVAPGLQALVLRNTSPPLASVRIDVQPPEREGAR